MSHQQGATEVLEGKGAALRRSFAARDIVRVQMRQIDENRPFTRDEV